MNAERKWAKAVEILDNGDLTQTETLVALGILRHSDDDLAEAAPGGQALAHYGRVKKRSAIAKAIAGLKAKGIVRNRHAGFHARVFTFADEVAAAVIAYRETLPTVRPTPPPCAPEGNINSACCAPEGNINVCPSGVQQAPPPCAPEGNINSACCAPEGNINVCPSGVQHGAPSLPKRSEGKGEGETETDLFGGRGPVVGVSYPSALMRALEKGSAPVAASALEDAVRAQLKAGAPPEDIEGAMRKAVAHAEDRKETTPSGLLKTAVGFVENAKRFSDERKKAAAARAASAAPHRALVVPNGKVEPLQPVAWEP